MEVGREHAGWHCYCVPSGLQETIVGRENREFRVPLSGDHRGKNNSLCLPFSSIRDQNCLYNDDQ